MLIEYYPLEPMPSLDKLHLSSILSKDSTALFLKLGEKCAPQRKTQLAQNAYWDCIAPTIALSIMQFAQSFLREGQSKRSDQGWRASWQRPTDFWRCRWCRLKSDESDASDASNASDAGDAGNASDAGDELYHWEGKFRDKEPYNCTAILPSLLRLTVRRKDK